MAQAPIFVSYSRKQFYVAEYLAHALEQKGFSAWLDVQQIQPGVDWQASIDHGLAICQALVLVASRTAYQSAAVQYEVSMARSAGKPIYLAVIEDTPFVAELGAVATVVDCQSQFSSGVAAIAKALQTGKLSKKPYRRAHPFGLRMPFGLAKYVQLLCLNLCFLLGTVTLLLEKQVAIQGQLNARSLPFLVLAITPVALWAVSFVYSLMLLRAFRRQGRVTYLALELWPALTIFLFPFLFAILLGLSTQAIQGGTDISFGAFFNGSLTITNRSASDLTLAWLVLCEISAWGMYCVFLTFTLRGWLLALAWIPLIVIEQSSFLPAVVLPLALLVVSGSVVFLSMRGFLNGRDVPIAFGEKQSISRLLLNIGQPTRVIPIMEPPHVDETQAWGRWLTPGSFPNEAFVRSYQPTREAEAATAGRVKTWRLSYVSADESSAQAIRRLLAEYPELRETSSEQADYQLALLSNKTPRRWVDALAARYPSLVCIIISSLDFSLLATTLQQHQWIDYRQQRPYQIHNLAKTLAGTASTINPTTPENFARTVGPYPFRLVVNALRMGSAASIVLAVAAQIIAISDQVARVPFLLIVISIAVGILTWWEAERLLTRNTFLPELLLTWGALFLTLGFWVVSGAASTLLPRTASVHHGTYNSTLANGLIFLVFFAGLPFLLFLVVAAFELVRNNGIIRRWLPRPTWPRRQQTLAVSRWRHPDFSVALYAAATLILIATLVVDSPYRYPHFHEYDVAPGSQFSLSKVLAGPDGNIWFYMSNEDSIGYITPNGAVYTRYVTIPQTAGCQTNISDCFTVHDLRFGPDHNLWYFAAQNVPPYTIEIRRVTLAGAVTRFPLPQHGFGSFGFAFDTDGNLWYFFQGNFIKPSYNAWVGKITISGSHESITEFTLPEPDILVSMVGGPDGNMWFFDDDTHAIGKVTPAGAITEYPLPYRGKLAGTAQEEIILGADHNLWFIDPQAGMVGRITPSGEITTYDGKANSHPRALLTAPDGSIWFRDDAQKALGHIPLGGRLVFYPLHAPMAINSSLTIGPDGNLWVTLYNQIARVTATGAITLYDVPTLDASLWGIVTGSDHHLWFVEHDPGIIGEFTP